jgi:ABC-type spermidine/putrescine transport system permease subunit II
MPVLPLSNEYIVAYMVSGFTVETLPIKIFNSIHKRPAMPLRIKEIPPLPRKYV